MMTLREMLENSAMTDAVIAGITGLTVRYVADLRDGMKADFRRVTNSTHCIRSNPALRRVRIALREGNTPPVRQARDAIEHCAYMAERYPGNASGCADEAMRLAPYAVTRAHVEGKK